MPADFDWLASLFLGGNMIAGKIFEEKYHAPVSGSTEKDQAAGCCQERQDGNGDNQYLRASDAF
jgi:hypothetical protein